MLRRGAAGVALVVMMSACGDAAVVETAVPLTLAPPSTSTSTSTSTTVTTTAESTSTSEFLSTTSTTEPFVPSLLCFEESPPPYGREGAAYEFDPTFYTHYCSASGIFVVGSVNTPIEALEAAGLRDRFKVLIGGGPVSENWAEVIGADAYGRDAAEAVRKAVEIMS